MDEPCSALDPRSTAVIEELIGELRRELAIVIVTHNLQQAYRVGDRVAFMYLGDLVEYGPTEQVFGAPRAQRTRDYVGGCLRVIRAAAAPLLRSLALALSACQTTQELSAQRAKSAKKLVNQKGLTVSRREPRRRGRRRPAIVQDANGIAAVVELRNTGKVAQADAARSRSPSPTPRGKALYRNDVAGPRGLARLDAAAGQGRGRLLGQQPDHRHRQAGQGPGAGRRGRRARCPRSSPTFAISSVALQSDSGSVFAKGTHRQPLEGRPEAPDHLRRRAQGRQGRRRRPRDPRHPAGRGRQAHPASPSSSSATRRARS